MPAADAKHAHLYLFSGHNIGADGIVAQEGA